MISQIKTELLKTPKRRLYLYGAFVVFLLIYSAWLILHKPDIKPGQTVTAPPAKVVNNEPKIAIQPEKVIVYRDKIRVVEKMGLPQPSHREEVQTTAEIPKLKYGGTAAVFLNTSTGQSRTEIKSNKAPWFAFKNDLAVGAGVGVGTEGKTLAGRIRYDIAQVKNLTISPELEVNYSENRVRQVEGKAMIWMEWRK